MGRRAQGWGWVVISVVVWGAMATLAAAAQKIVIPGTGSSQELLREMGRAFSKAHPGVELDVPDSTGTGGGIKAAGDGTADLGRVSRKLKDKEKDLNLKYLAFAKLPLIFCAHKSVPQLSLTTAQTRDIFSGKVTNWKDVGGPDLKIRVASRYEEDATIKEIRSRLDGWFELTISPNAKVTDTDPENIILIESSPGAVGFSTLNLALNANVTILDLDGRKPLGRGYPLLLEQGLVYKPEKMTGVVKLFVDFIFSPKGRAILEKGGAVPVSQ